MERNGFPEGVIEKFTPGIWEGDAKNGIKRGREYDVEYRRRVEEDIAVYSAS